MAMYAPPHYAAHVSEFCLHSRSLAFDDLRWLPAEGPCGLEQLFSTHAHVSLLLTSAMHCTHVLLHCFWIKLGEWCLVYHPFSICSGLQWQPCAMRRASVNRLALTNGVCDVAGTEKWFEFRLQRLRAVVYLILAEVASRWYRPLASRWSKMVNNFCLLICKVKNLQATPHCHAGRPSLHSQHFRFDLGTIHPWWRAQLPHLGRMVDSMKLWLMVSFK